MLRRMVLEDGGGDGGGAGRLRGGGLYYGWVMVAVATLSTVATSPGQSFLVGTFNDAIRSDLGLSLSALSGAYMVATFCASLPLTLVGKASDRFGTRAVMAAVALAFGGACWFIGGSAWAVEGLGLDGGAERFGLIAALTVSFFLLRFLGQGALGLVSSHVLAMWFERRLGFAESVRHLGMPLANAVLPVVVIGLIGVVGWRLAYGVLGVSVWVLVLPLVWLVYVNRPEDVGQRVDGDRGGRGDGKGPVVGGVSEGGASDHRTVDPGESLDVGSEGGVGGSPAVVAAGGSALVEEPSGAGDGEWGYTLGEAMSTRAYWTVVACLIANAFAGTAFVFHRQPMFEDLGLAREAAEGAMVTFGLVSFAMTLPAGWVADRLPLNALLGLATVGLGVACGLYAAAGMSGVSLAVLHCGYGVLGVSQALMFVLASPILARFFGRPHHGVIRGSLTTFMVVGTSAGPLGLSLIRDVTGDFSLPYALVGVVAVPLSVLALAMRAPARRAVATGATDGGVGR